ncbi:MAG: isochorismatase family cysteine hydrolase [Dehalococcoidia bacterium]|jgi:nicotinamidase-related amidase
MKKNPVVYKNMREIVDPSHTALVLWDVQDALVNVIFNRQEFLLNLKTLTDAARKHGVPVIYTKITPLPLSWESSFRLYMQMKRSHVDSLDKLRPFPQAGSPEAEINGEVKPLEGDIVLDKHTASIFVGTHFENLMKNAGITTILFTGISTEFGISSSARDAANRGFYPVVVEDCVSSSVRDMHEAALKTMAIVSIVVPSADIIREWA